MSVDVEEDIKRLTELLEPWRADERMQAIAAWKHQMREDDRAVGREEDE